MQIFTNTQLQLHQVALARHRPVRGVILAGLRDDRASGAAARHRLLGRHGVIVKFRSRSARTRSRRRRRVPGEKAVQQDAATPATTASSIRLPQGGREKRRQPREGRQGAERRRQGREPRAVPGNQPRGRRPGHRQGPAAQGHLRDAALDPRHHCLHRLRFRLTFAIGAIAATCHDILVTLAFLVCFGYDLSLNVIAALLTITGYSVNDTIVIFDRVRENMRTMRRDDLEKVVNDSVNQTLARTVITAGTTFLAVLALYLFGGEVLEGFAFTMLVGIVSGTYSTVFIAAAVAIMMSKRAAGPPAGAAAAAQAAGTGRPAAEAGDRTQGQPAPPGPALIQATRAMSILIAALLGVVQGITEFLPVSSSAHLLLGRAPLGWGEEPFGLVFDVPPTSGPSSRSSSTSATTSLAMASWRCRGSSRRAGSAPDAPRGHRHDPGRHRRPAVRRLDRSARSTAGRDDRHAVGRRHRPADRRAPRPADAVVATT